MRIAGCHPGDCHYAEGNYKAMRRGVALKMLLKAQGIDPRRLRVEWISAAEGEKYARVVNEMTEEIRSLGPLHPVEAPAPAAAAAD